MPLKGRVKIITNLKTNLDDEKDKSDVKSEREETIQNKPDIYGMVAVQMIYFLLAFVIKYVYIKTPTPVISAHKF